MGHPYLDVVDNSTSFEVKINRVIQVYFGCKFIQFSNRRMSASVSVSMWATVWPSILASVNFLSPAAPRLESGDCFGAFPRPGFGAPSTDPQAWPCKFQDFEVEHVYLLTTDGTQARIRRRGQGAHCTFQHTVRRHAAGPRERRVLISSSEYSVR